MARQGERAERPLEVIVAPDMMTGRVLASLRLGLEVYMRRAGNGIKRSRANKWADEIYEGALDRLIPKDER